MSSEKWHMNRLGLIDFWFYDNEEFNFNDGHMLLRGSNGSGKSVTLQSFIPLILDGNRNSSRIDPFGSRSRKLEDYLLDEDGDRDERIGYLYLEFKREGLDLYKTIGMGMRAKRNTPLNIWYFVIEDNRRIGKDLDLYVKNLAVTKQVLKSKIGDQFIETQKEYMSKVNQSLFGFHSDDEYKEVLDLLIQLRTPKLSNSLKPTMLNEILNNALQPLSDDDLRPMTEAISSMDTTQDQIEAIKISIQSIRQILNVYHQYNHSVLLEKGERLLESQGKLNELEKQLKECEGLIIEASTTQTRLKEELQKIRLEEDVLNQEKMSLKKDDISVLTDEIELHKKELLDLSQVKEAKNHRISDKEVLFRQEDSNIKKYTEDLALSLNKIQKIFSEMEELQNQLQFEEHIIIKDELMGNLEHKFEANYTFGRINHELETLDKGLKLFSDLDKEMIEQTHYKKRKDVCEYEMEKLVEEKKDTNLKLLNLQDNITTEFYSYSANNQYLKLTEEDLVDISEIIKTTHSFTVANQIEVIINKRYLEVYKSQNALHNKYESTLVTLQNNQETLWKELEYWKHQTEVSFELEETTQKNRIQLQSLNIPHISFYKLLEFDNDISEEARNKVEEVLKSAGILDIQVVNIKDKETIESITNTKDRYFFTTQTVQMLEEFVIDDSFVKEDDWSSLFQSLGIEDIQFKSLGNLYSFHKVWGSVTLEETAKYIGVKAREAYRQENIKRVEHEINDIKEQIQLTMQEIKLVTQTLKDLDIEKHKVPHVKALVDTLHLLSQLEQRIIEKHREVNDYQIQIELLENNLSSLRLTISEFSNELGIHTSQIAFTQRKQYLTQYMQQFNYLLAEHKDYLWNDQMLKTAEMSRDLHNDDITLLREELASTLCKISKNESLLKQKSEQLDSLGFKDILKRIEEIDKRTYEIKEIILHHTQELGRLESVEEEKNQQLETIKGVVSKQIEETQTYKKYYEDELNLKYVSESVNVKSVMNQIKEAYPNLRRRDILHTQLQQSIYENRGNLQEYALTQHSLFDDNQHTSRIDISARYTGENMNIIKLNEYLSNSLIEQELLLREKDRELIEEILINTISKKVRTRIQQSRLWIERINKYMNNMNTSSGLKLNLQWKSRKAETEDELNSERLSSLLETDVRLLKDADRDKLSSHFKSKITVARKKAEMEENYESFHQIMRDVMDFRNWFDFKIMVHKTGEKTRELTNNGFNTFSGGEKAMSMYIPLFSAVAAKFEGGKEDAPHIIALDEAFAGVDENNITNMFELIRKFNFDYIMNSQVLWGDYPSVPTLAIYELYRPENAKFVTIVRYEWNGHIKKLVS